MIRHGWVVLLLVPIACAPTRNDVDTSRPRDAGEIVSNAETLAAEGESAYLRYCVGCHGEKGDGAGEAAKFLFPKPRNFTLANFKFSSTRSGLLPTDADLKRTIRRGLKGSAMPEFEFLPDRTLDELVAYIKRFSPKWKERDPAAPIPIIEDPYRSLADKAPAIQRGEVVYHGYATCWNCHPSYATPDKMNEYLAACGGSTRTSFRQNLSGVEAKENVEGQMVYPTDFRRDFVRSGTSVDDLYRTIAAGLTGTAMPTWVDSMSVPAKQEGAAPLVQPADLWAMAYYVQSLIEQRPQKLMAGALNLRARSQGIYLNGEPPKSAKPAAPEAPAEEFIEP